MFSQGYWVIKNFHAGLKPLFRFEHYKSYVEKARNGLINT